MSPAAKVSCRPSRFRRGADTPVLELEVGPDGPEEPEGYGQQEHQVPLDRGQEAAQHEADEEPEMAATLLIPSPRPRWSAGKASVTMAEELAKSMAPPTPCPTRMAMSQSAAAGPVIHVIARRTENTVNTAKPRLKIRTRPNMSPTRPNETTARPERP